MIERSGNGRDALLVNGPVEDQGAKTGGWYGFQHNCALRLLLAAIAADEAAAVICETHEDILLISSDGSVSEAIGVKHRERNQPWTAAELLRSGGIVHLFGTWRRADRSIATRLMTNAHLHADAERGLRACRSGEEDRTSLLRSFVSALRCGEDEARAFIAALRFDTGLPHRHHIAATQAGQLLAPALSALSLRAADGEGAYRAALHLVSDRSKDTDPLEEDARLVLLRGAALGSAERDARLKSRTVTTEQLGARLREAAGRRGTGGTRIREVHPVILPRSLVERDTVVERIRTELERRDARVVAIQAVGGEGKSTVVKHLVVELSPSRFERIFTFSFERDSPEAFLEEACRFFLADDRDIGDQPPFAQARRLAESLLERDTLLVLNELEWVLVRERGNQRGRFASRELRELLRLLLSAPRCRTKVLLTTRLVPVEIESAAGFEPYVLPPLGRDEAVAFLRKRGVVGAADDLAAASERFFGHALTLAVLSDFLKRSRWRGDIAGTASFTGLPKDRDGRLAAVLESYAELLSDLERDLVIAIAASHGGLPREALASIGDTLEVGADRLDTALGNLTDTVLLADEPAPAAGGLMPEARLTTHPLVGGHFLDRGPAERVVAIRRTLAAFHAERTPPGEAPSVERSRAGIAAFQQYVALRDWETAQEFYSTRLPVSRQLFWAGHYRVCESLSAPLLEAWRSGSHHPSKERVTKLLTDAGCVTAKVAGVDPALASFSEAARLADAGSAAHARAVLYGVEGALEGGRCLLARERLEEALEGGGLDPGSHQVTGRLGYLHACLGDHDYAVGLLSEAIDTARRDEPLDYLCLFTRVRADLAIRFERLPEAHDDIDSALKIARGPLPFLDYEGHLLRARGDAHLAEGELDNAHSHYRQALRIGRETGYAWLQAEALIGLGRWSLADGVPQESLRFAGEALAIAENGGWWLERGRAHVLRARLEHAAAEHDAEVGDGPVDLNAASRIAAESGHHLLDLELEQLHRDGATPRSEPETG